MFCLRVWYRRWRWGWLHELDDILLSRLVTPRIVSVRCHKHNVEVTARAICASLLQALIVITINRAC